jgi:hypothetical protein
MPSSAARAVLLLILLVASASALNEARSRPFWYDDVVTIDVASLGDLAQQRAALSDGVDSQPFGYFLLLRVANTLPLPAHVRYRLPSIGAYVAAILAAFLLIQRRYGGTAALLAATLVATSPLPSGAEVVRSYVLLVGFVGASAVCWQRVSQSRWFVAGLWLFLTGAVASHHFGLVAIGCLAVPELVENAMARRVRWPVWVVFLLATTPFIVGLPTLLHFREVFGEHFWSRASLDQIPQTYSALATISGRVVAWLALVVAGGAALSHYFGFRGPRGTDMDRPRIDPSSLPDLVMMVMLALYPIWLVVPTWLAGSAYVARYAEPAVIGLAATGVVLLRSIARPWTVGAVCFGCLAVFFSGEIDRLHSWLGPVPPVVTLADRLHGRFPSSGPDAALPIVIADGLDYIPLVYYSAGTPTSRYVHLADPDVAIRMMGADTLDRTDILLSHIVPMRVERLQEFLASHDRFFLYASRSAFSWLPRYLTQANYRLTLLSDDGSVAYLVEAASHR